MSIVSIVIQILLTGMFTFSAAIKWLQTDSMVRHWHQYRYPMWLMKVIAFLELAGAAGMMAGFWLPEIRAYAAALFIVLMLGAIHAPLVRARHKPFMAVNASLMLLLSAVLIVMN